MPEPEVLAMLSHSQEFEQVKVSTLTAGNPQSVTRCQQHCEKKEKVSEYKIWNMDAFISH